MTPAAAIRAATVDAAELLGRSASLGTIEPGKDADIIAVAGDPVEDVTRLERVDFVMRRGVVHKLGGERQVFSVR
jgi:imidazolonepropionase-like amidohydrolase